MNLTEEEKKMPVTFGDLEKLILAAVDGMKNGQVKLNDEILGMIGKLADGAAQIYYERLRDMRFFLNLLSDLGFGTKHELYSHYDKWCCEYDKLNKGYGNKENNYES